jgi:tetratricopeptide (TPR) repeat protein
MKLNRILERLVLGVATMAASAVLVSGPTFAAEKEKDKNKVSKELAPSLKAAQEALQAKKFPDAIAKLKEAEGNPKKSPYDQHIINELAGVAYAKQNNFAEATKYFEAEINDGFLDEKEVPGRIKAVAQMNYQLKNYDKAIEYGNRAIKGGFADDEMKTLVGQSYYLKGDYKALSSSTTRSSRSRSRRVRRPRTSPCSWRSVPASS